MNSNQSFVPRFQLRNMSGYTEEEGIELDGPPRYSFDSVAPSASTSQPHSSWSFNEEERPNRVISGHRKLNRGFYTGPRTNFDSHASKIVKKLEQDDDLMNNTPVSEQKRMEALRDLPQCLTMKRCVKMKLSKSVSRKSKRKPIGFWKSLKYRMSIAFSRFVGGLRNFSYFQLWHNTLKDIEGHFGSGYASYFKFLRWLFVMNCIVAVVAFVMLVLPQIIIDTSTTNENGTITYGFEFADLFTGNGFFTRTVFYYGHYTHDNPYYDMPAAYFATTVFLYLMSLIVLAVSVAEFYRRTFIETEGGLQNIYANRIFCGWDFGIATKEAAELKSSAIYNELKELLTEELEEREEMSCLLKFWTYTIQIIVNILVLVLLAAIGWSIWLLLEFAAQRQDNSIIVPAVTVNLIMMTFPSIFHYIAEYEDYKNPRTTIYITLTRTYLLGGVMVGVVISFWLIRAQQKTDCWEDQLGAEMYRLIMFDFLFSVILGTLIDLGYCMGRYFRGYDPKSEFNIARHTLQIVYNQGLFWVGFVYSPVLPLLVTLKMWLIWYIRKGCVRNLCRAPKRTWRAAQAQTWFMTLIFVSILLIIVTHGYTFQSIEASSCGPFKNYTHIYEILTSGIENLKEGGEFWRVVMNVSKPGGVAFIVIGLLIMIYYSKEHAAANRKKAKLLREMLVWMAKDKKYLVQWYNEVTKGHLDTSFQDGRFMDPTRVQPHEYNTNFVDYGSVDDEELNARFKKFF